MAGFRHFSILMLLAVALISAGCGGGDGDQGKDSTQQDMGPGSDLNSVLDSSAADVLPLDTLPGDSSLLDTADQTGDAEPREDTVSMLEKLPIASCGMPEYQLLPTEQVGHLLEWEAMDFWDMSASEVDAILAMAGTTALSPIPFGCQIYKFRYTTQDRGEQTEATAFLSIPRFDGAAHGPLPVALYTHGTSGFSDPCAPTHPDAGLAGPAVPALMAALGYITVAPDYIGMAGFGDHSTVKHAYLVGEQTAIGSWDAVRAGLELVEELGNPVESDGRVIPWGASQGGHAAVFVELYAPYYAPEFEVPAVIAMVPPLSLEPLIKANVEKINSGTGNLAINLVASYLWYGEQGDLSQVITNEEPLFLADILPDFLFPMDKCEFDMDIDLSTATVEMLFTEFFRQEALADRVSELVPWGCYYKENSLISSSVPVVRRTPTLVTFGENDTLVYTPAMRDAYVELCNAGYEMEYIECAGAGHSEGALWSLPDQLDWLEARLAGEPMNEASICKVMDPICCLGSPDDAECRQ